MRAARIVKSRRARGGALPCALNYARQPAHERCRNGCDQVDRGCEFRVASREANLADLGDWNEEEWNHWNLELQKLSRMQTRR